MKWTYCSSTGIPYGSAFWGSQMAVSSGAYHRAWDYIFREDPAEDISETKTGERIAGGLLVVGIVAASSFVPWLILHLAYGFRTWLGVALESFMCYQLLAARSLRDEVKKSRCAADRRY